MHAFGKVIQEYTSGKELIQKRFLYANNLCCYYPSIMDHFGERYGDILPSFWQIDLSHTIGQRVIVFSHLPEKDILADFSIKITIQYEFLSPDFRE